MIVREHRHPVVVVGTRAQRASANAIVRDLSSEMVANACGVWSWQELVRAVDAAPYVVANNSGVAHLAASRGRWTLCVFASHAYCEWMPRGPRVVTLVKALPCSPCSLGAERCSNGAACMVDFSRPRPSGVSITRETAWRRWGRLKSAKLWRCNETRTSHDPDYLPLLLDELVGFAHSSRLSVAVVLHDIMPLTHRLGTAGKAHSLTWFRPRTEATTASANGCGSRSMPMLSR